jgi:hypothetical protein
MNAEVQNIHPVISLRWWRDIGDTPAVFWRT